MALTEITDSNFEEFVKKDGIVLIDFWAPWCGPCRSFGPIFEKAAEDNGDIAFAKCNTEEQQTLAAGLNIRSIPTLMVFRDNVLLFNQAGALHAPALEELITKTRELDMEVVKSELEKQQQAQ